MTLWRRLVRFGFRLLYREMAFMYDAISWLVSGGEWRTWILAGLTVAQPKPDEMVLEVAHGTGTLQVELAERGLSAWGVDYSAQMVRIAGEKLRRNKFPSQLARAKGQALPFSTGAFDVLICTFPSEFLLESATLSEFKRVLKPDGRGVIVLHGALIRGGGWVRLMDGLFRITGQGRIARRDVPTSEDLADGYQRILAKMGEAGLVTEARSVVTARGYAAVITFVHPKIGDDTDDKAGF